MLIYGLHILFLFKCQSAVLEVGVWANLVIVIHAHFGHDQLHTPTVSCQRNERGALVLQRPKVQITGGVRNN